MNYFEELLRQANDARTRIRELSPREARSFLENGTLLIDVREESEFKTGHISGAIPLSLEAIESRIGETVPDKATPLMCYCNLGHRSALAADKLQKLGYSSVASIEGGLKAYLAGTQSRQTA
ncbi:MAG: rhodanese-like domain-containing protein [Methylothermaceae bacterium]|nr:rhodanese-like domain-containing protein [Methylothermaceae bacterium]